MKNKLPFILSNLLVHDNSGWKLDDDGHVVMKDGNPVYLNGGNEMTVRGDTISQLNGEAQRHREEKQALEKKLKAYDGLDAEQARQAITKLADVDLSKMIDKGEIDKVKAQIQSEYNTLMEEKDGAIGKLQSEIDGMKIDSIFNSKFVQESVAVPHDMFQASFRNNFKVEDGKINAYDKSGNRLMSKEHIGEPASPEEALKLLVDAHPQKDTILKADIGNGSGSNGSGGNRGTGRILKRAEYDKLPPVKQAELAGKMASGELQIVD